MCGSPAPWSACPLERCGWTQDLPQFRQWLDALTPAGGGPMQPLLAGALLTVPQACVVAHGPEHACCSTMNPYSAAEALAEAIYLFQCPSALGSSLGDVQGHCMVLLASEPCRIMVPWPYPDQCSADAPCQASWAELAQVPFQPLL